MVVTALKAGAFDYVVKDVQGEFIYLLKAALQGAVNDMRLRRAKEAAEAEVREARDRFEALAAERALLMREVNHRVGNSLQIISSLLTLQANATDDSDVRKALSSAIGRVMAVAQIHRRLYTSDDVQSVSVDLYLQALIEDLRRSAESNALAQLTLKAEPIVVDPDRAIATGIIVNELVTNALKYAYPGGQGPIRVALKRLENERAIISVEDDGVGVSATVGARNATGLGQRIVRAMGEKLNARIMNDASYRQGTRMIVDFDLPAARAPSNAAAAPGPTRAATAPPVQ
jgi:two-component sensor histidine kinase